MHKGVPVSPGVVVARAYCVDEVLARREPQALDAAALSTEVVRFENAVVAAGNELEAVVASVRQQLGEDEAAIFRGHKLLLRDPALIAKVKTTILHKKVDAPSALHEALDDYTQMFEKIADEYFRERLADIRDVIGRIMSQLAQSGKDIHCLQMKEPVILVAPEVLPSQAAALECLNIVGIITEAGGSTGHAAILARARGIPSVSGLRGIRERVATGDLLVLDGRTGHVLLRPDAETEAAYRKLQREYVDLRDSFVHNRDQEAVTLDGAQVELLANVNGPADAETAQRSGATGVGLYRTEYLFLTHPTVPNEEEQLAAYRAVVEAAPNRTVTIRTLDIGGDKLVPYFGHEREANPFMGWRSIRITSAYPEFFQTQLRAILRAGLHGKISLLFPMITTLEEVRRIRKQVERAKQQLRSAGVAFQDNVPLGVMMEVPAAALSIHALLREIDFLSIGSNDLTQYVMAADRDNPKVAHFCEPFSPPVLRLLRHILRACVRQGKPVTLCGEMAGRPRCFLPLFGMGLRRFSMSPGFVPTIKELVRRSTLEVAQAVAEKVRRLRTFNAVRKFLTRATREVCPNVAALDTRR
ncbi:MAG: phosphoenolpyruvate--protein phosphotransferase [Gemmataceae bacterium]|nr:phosphoenolpyruvate--protein phosphotransferase [Gemmataceae bacterium]MCI0741221.1 phosphoenolpyruvate--protein phosphotransferase [Gemmataceae bacterium]